MTTNEVLQVVDSIPPGPEGMIVAVPGSVGALEPDAIDTTTLLSQVNKFLVRSFSTSLRSPEGGRWVRNWEFGYEIVHFSRIIIDFIRRVTISKNFI